MLKEFAIDTSTLLASLGEGIQRLQLNVPAWPHHLYDSDYGTDRRHSSWPELDKAFSPPPTLKADQIPGSGQRVQYMGYIFLLGSWSHAKGYISVDGPLDPTEQ